MGQHWAGHACIIWSVLCLSSCGAPIAITSELISNSWQSSTHGNNNDYCFRPTAEKVGHWSYFTSGFVPDSSGYQWLLMKLTRSVLVRSVTVTVRTEERDRARNIEVLLSDKPPTGLLSTEGSCTATFTHDLSGFTLCGLTEATENATLRQEVKCMASGSSQPTGYILLRRYVLNATDKFMNFQGLEIDDGQPESLQIHLQTRQTVKAGTTVNFLLTVSTSDTEASPALPTCELGGRDLGTPQEQAATFANATSSYEWLFEALVSDNGLRISCRVVQANSLGAVVYNQSVISQPLNVLYSANNSWSATRTLVVMEGDTLSVSVTSLGGNPVPSHQCWMLTADSRHDLKVTKSEVDQRDDEIRVMNNFSVTSSTRRMNGGSVMCRVTQEGQPDMSQNFTQNITVLSLVPPSTMAPPDSSGKGIFGTASTTSVPPDNSVKDIFGTASTTSVPPDNSVKDIFGTTSTKSTPLDNSVKNIFDNNVIILLICLTAAVLLAIVAVIPVTAAVLRKRTALSDGRRMEPVEMPDVPVLQRDPNTVYYYEDVR